MNRHIVISRDNPRCPACNEYVSRAMLQCTVRVTITVELSPDLPTIESRGAERIQGADYFYVCSSCGHPLTANSEELLAIFQAAHEYAAWADEGTPTMRYDTTMTAGTMYNVVEGAGYGGTMDIRQGNRREQ